MEDTKKTTAKINNEIVEYDLCSSDRFAYREIQKEYLVGVLFILLMDKCKIIKLLVFIILGRR